MKMFWTLQLSFEVDVMVILGYFLKNLGNFSQSSGHPVLNITFSIFFWYLLNYNLFHLPYEWDRNRQWIPITRENLNYLELHIATWMTDTLYTFSIYFFGNILFILKY
jgi:hypothetical protein